MAWSGRGTGRASSCGCILSPPRSAAEAEPEPEPPPPAAGAAAAAAAAAAGPVVPAAHPPRTTAEAAAGRWKSPWRFPEESEALFPRRKRPADRERGRGDSRLEPVRGVKKVVGPGDNGGIYSGEGGKEGRRGRNKIGRAHV